jgi:RNA polymerase sigma factor (sigma-70 family)
LLRAFVMRRDAPAFEQIVRRHGPMVLGVCRRVLRDPADADDAFQATFLVLVRKAGSLRQPDRLAGWLHQVAHRIARKARALRMRRSRHEGELFDVPAGEAPAEFLWPELRPIFDTELDRLPDRLRLPAVLCLLEGHSKAEAARVLGWPEGTVSCRLQRAREKLRLRLAARGLTLSAGALAAALFEGAGSAAVPDRLIVLTIQGVTTAANAAAVRALADGATQAMFLAKVKTAAAAVLVVGATGTGTGVALIPGSGPGVAVASEPMKGSTVNQAPSAPRTSAEPKAASTEPADLDRAVQRQELELLRDRLAFEERMVRKGFMTESQVKKTRLEVARAEAALAKAEPPMAPDPRRQAMEATVRKLEEIVEQTRQGVKKGVIPLQELLNSEATLARYKFEQAALDDRPATQPAKVSAEQRTAMEAVIRKMEEIVARTEDGVKKGVIPQQELLNAQLKLLEFKFKLAELTGPTPGESRTAPPVRRGDAAAIADKLKELERAETLLKQHAISLEEIRRLRVGLNRLQAQAAAARGEYSEAARQLDAAVAEIEADAAAIRAGFERKTCPRSDLRAAEVSLAEARIEALRAHVRQQLATIVSAREVELREVRALYDSKAATSEEVQRAERALSEAKARLAAGR